MGSLFRSQPMTLCQLFLQSEAAYSCVSELGELGLVQFRDLKPDTNAFQRKFVTEIRRCDEMERKLRYLEKEIGKDAIPVLDSGESPEAPNPREMVDLEANLEKLENELRDVNNNEEALKRNFLELTELKHVLRKTQAFFEESANVGASNRPEHRGRQLDDKVGLINDDVEQQQQQQQQQEHQEEQQQASSGLQLQFVAGVVHRNRLPAFERMLWRVCRGNALLRHADIDAPLEEPATGDEVLKTVFVIFFQGEQLKTRVKKICEGFRASLYPCPEGHGERREMAISVMTRIEDLNTVLNTTIEHRRRLLMSAARNLRIWFIRVGKIKAIYHALNQFDFEATNKCLIGEAWCAIDDLERVKLALRRGTERAGSAVPPILNRLATKERPPTYFRLNKLAVGFQNIIDAYGVASYMEANPAPFAIVTFPFLFGVMYGDFGHGLLMFLAALWMVLREKQLAGTTKVSEIWATFFNGRYIILLMGAFSIYTGLIYNDIFSKSVNIFGSSWSVKGQYPGVNVSLLPITVRDPESVQLSPNMTQTQAWSGNPYYFGLDPIWQVSINKITFTNTIKMKASIVIGVLHMMFGVCVGLTNHFHRRDYLSVIGEFVPQVLFLMSMFGYLVVLIVYKWLVYSGESSNCAPSLLIGLINMFLMKYEPPLKDCTVIYAGYNYVQIALVIIVVLCVPWMLLAKPLVLVLRQRRGASGQVAHARLNEADGEDGDDEGGNRVDGVQCQTEEEEMQQEFDVGELFVHQTIHTIEYCLGCISNTASYLRLWALSLAHAQLSEVLWQMVLAIGLKQANFFGSVVLFFVFAFWAILTVCVLLLMEGLSAFLHALRLHWVEFMNKFYGGEGVKFEAFSFAEVDVGGE